MIDVYSPVMNILPSSGKKQRTAQKVDIFIQMRNRARVREDYPV